MLISDIFPGFGYFGPSPSNGLRVGVNRQVQRLRVSLLSYYPEILNLRGITLFDSNGKQLNFKANKVIVNVSSSWEDNDSAYGAQSIYKSGQIHTKREKNPWVEFSFSEAQELRDILILNRQDQYGKRSDTLRVDAYDGNIWHNLFENRSTAGLLDLLARLFDILPIQLSIEHFKNRTWREFRIEVKKHLLAIFDATPHVLKEKDYDWILSLMDVYDGKHVDQYDEELIAAYFSNQVLLGRNVDPPVVARHFLNTKEKIETAEVTIWNRLQRNSVNRRYMFTRHGLFESTLISNAENYVTLARQVCRTVEQCGGGAMLCYGSLLGAIRDGGFIPHDDDVDLLYYHGATSQKEAIERAQRLMECFVKQGLRVIQTSSSFMNFHVLDRTLNVSVDIFPCWEQGDQLYLHMERMSIKSLPKDIFFPSGSIVLYGTEFSVPADSNKFLTARYGNCWGIPDKYFEWPYPLL